MTELDAIRRIVNNIDCKCDEMLRFKAVHEETHKRVDRALMDMHETLYAKPAGLSYTVERMLQNGKTRRSIARPWRQLCFAIFGKITTAVIIFIAAWLLSAYRAGPIPPAAEAGEPTPASNALNVNERPYQ